ncbi:hypothetical protein GCM10011349_43950 [Novosphingobium indicum]|uniref:Uncharacterized protein n=1 Tax=Novosphingobium indicum TaxID=462949 RepID=A0ABQ2K0R5_9SPHN|nr:hypothetical protein GCM10011349_43950 [Novosphingobium indicum]
MGTGTRKRRDRRRSRRVGRIKGGGGNGGEPAGSPLGQSPYDWLHAACGVFWRLGACPFRGGTPQFPYSLQNGMIALK